MRVAVCIPAYGDFKRDFALSLYDLQDAAHAASIKLERHCVSRTLIDKARQILAERAFSSRADYLLWLDTDMVFPPNTLDRLLAHDLPVVGANCRLRGDGSPSASMRAERNGRPGFLPVAPKPDGIETVDVIGLAVCLMKTEVLRGLPLPWFSMVKQGEDGFFFERLFEEKGIRPVVDHALSMEVGHIAETVLKWGRT